MSLIIQANSASASGGYEVDNSCRFNSGSSDRLYKSQSTGNQKTYTFSFWIKRSILSAQENIIGAKYGGQSRYAFLRWNGDDPDKDKLEFHSGIYSTSSTSTSMSFKTNRVFRDVSAWYHIVLAVDTTQGTESNRVKIYVNGVQETSFTTATYPSVNQNHFFNINTTTLEIGAQASDSYLNAYIAEFVLIDGLQLAADSFGEFDDSGIWKPINVSGLTFGTNGFYLDFEDSANLGNDANGGTDLTEANLTAVDQSTDTCTNNFATLNPLIYESRDNTFAEGNLKISAGGADSWTTHYGLSTIAVSTGKWFVEAKMTTKASAHALLGLISTSQAITSSLKDNGVVAVEKEGRITGGGNNLQTGLTEWSNGEIAGIAFDADNGTVQFYRQGSAYGSAVSSIASDTYYFATTSYQATAVMEFNFGSPPYSESGGNSDGDGYGNFSMAVPSGYFALNTKNLAEYG